jgi:hypothetical protein
LAVNISWPGTIKLDPPIIFPDLLLTLNPIIFY